MARHYVKQPHVEIYRSAYNHKLEELEAIRKTIQTLLRDRVEIAQDGTDDENPAYGENSNSLTAAYRREHELELELSNYIVVDDPVSNDDSTFSEATKSVVLLCTFPEDDAPVTRDIAIGYGPGFMSPNAPLFKFLLGKSVGFKGLFVNRTPQSVTSYDVEIQEIRF